MKNFTTWLENKVDIFGFEKDIQRKEQQKRNVKETPVESFNVESMMDYLLEMKLPGKNPSMRFTNQIQWGENVGAVKVKMGTTLQLMIEKLSTDLEGNPTWVTKKFYQINRSGYGGFEHRVAIEVFGEVEKIDKILLDSPKNEYKDLPGLVIGIASQLRRSANDIFIFDGIKRINDKNFIIKMNIRASGLEARDHQKVIENLTDISFSEKTGKIRIMNSCVKSKTGGSQWKLTPNDIDMYFMPTQNKDEIVESISTYLKWY
jgi:hypothetical protein